MREVVRLMFTDPLARLWVLFNLSLIATGVILLLIISL